MQFQEFYLNAGANRIFTLTAAPETVRGAVVLVHGMGEHSGRYFKSVVPMLWQSSLAVVLFDHTGHGKSDGKRGHCPSYQHLMDVMDLVVTRTAMLYPGIPLFLYGHSMGGNLVLNYVLRNATAVRAVIATSPFLRLAFEPPRWKLLLGKLMLRMAPSLTLPSGLDPQAISRMKEEVEAYQNDPLVHDLVSPMYTFPVMEAGEWAMANAHRLGVSTLLCHGTGDRITDHRATAAFNRCSDRTKLHLFEEGHHELHHDYCRGELFDLIGKWLKEQFV